MNFVPVNRVKIAYSRCGAGVPLVLVHGFPLDSSIWKEVVPLLEVHFDLVTPDLRGFGASTTIDSAYSMADMADDLAGLLDHLGVEKAALAGHSMGGYVCLAFANKYPARIRGLGLISSQIFADTAERREGRLKEAAGIADHGTGVIVEGMATRLSADGKVQDIVRRVMKQQTAAGMIGALKAMAGREDSAAFLSTANFPIVLLHGDGDALIPIEKAREMKTLVPFARLIELPRAGHMPMLESPRETAAGLRFLG